MSRRKENESQDVKGRIAAEATEVLCELGSELSEIDPALRASAYMGSAAVHIYRTENLGQVLFVTQVNTLRKTPELIASQAFDELRVKMMQQFGRKG